MNQTIEVRSMVCPRIWWCCISMSLNAAIVTVRNHVQYSCSLVNGSSQLLVVESHNIPSPWLRNVWFDDSWPKLVMLTQASPLCWTMHMVVCHLVWLVDYDVQHPKHGPYDDFIGAPIFVMLQINLRHLLYLSTSTISNEHMTQMYLHQQPLVYQGTHTWQVVNLHVNIHSHFPLMAHFPKM